MTLNPLDAGSGESSGERTPMLDLTLECSYGWKLERPELSADCLMSPPMNVIQCLEILNLL